MSVEIISLEKVTDAVVEAFGHLIPQLSDVSPPTKEALEAIVAAPGTTIFLAVDPLQSGKIVGALTVAVFQTPVAVHAWIEDVVVDSAYRNHGIGEALTRAGMKQAAALGAKHVDLTSRPQREAANRLYQRIGFELRTTNLYRIELED